MPNRYENLKQTLAEITIKTELGASLYPPERFPNKREYGPENWEVQVRFSSDKGILLPAEAAALSLVLKETARWSENFGVTLENTRKLNEELNVPGGVWMDDVIKGANDVALTVCIAAGVRGRIVAGESGPGKTDTIGDLAKSEAWKLYAESIRKDRNTIGQNTIGNAVEFLSAVADKEIHELSELAKNEIEIQQRINCYRHGLKLGRDIYLSSLEVAKKLAN